MLGKILLLALAVWLLYFILKQYHRSVNGSAPPRVEPEDMVRCRKCGVHLPKPEGIMLKGDYYCCEDHAKQARQ